MKDRGKRKRSPQQLAVGPNLLPGLIKIQFSTPNAGQAQLPPTSAREHASRITASAYSSWENR
jgi:hypothetical protein